MSTVKPWKRLECIVKEIEKSCMDEYVSETLQQELTPLLESIYNIAVGSLDKGLDGILKEHETWDKFKKLNYEKDITKIIRKEEK